MQRFGYGNGPADDRFHIYSMTLGNIQLVPSSGPGTEAAGSRANFVRALDDPVTPGWD
jgi:hypothetical protein